MTKKIVVTGLGTSSPLGGNVADSWKALLAGESGVSTLEQDWVAEYELPVTFAAQAKVPSSELLERVETKRLDPSSQFALIAAREAWADAGSPDVDPLRVSVDFATGIGGIWTLVDAWEALFRAQVTVMRTLHSEFPESQLTLTEYDVLFNLSRHPQLGWSYVAWQKLWRLAGADHMHVNGLGNKFSESDDSVIASARTCLTPMSAESPCIAMPVFSSGQTVNQPPETYRQLGSLMSVIDEAHPGTVTLRGGRHRITYRVRGVDGVGELLGGERARGLLERLFEEEVVVERRRVRIGRGCGGVRRSAARLAAAVAHQKMLPRRLPPPRMPPAMLDIVLDGPCDVALVLP